MQPLALNLRATAAALSISYDTLRDQLYSGRFPIPVRKLGGRRIVAVADIQAFLRGDVVTDPAPTPAPEQKPSLPAEPTPSPAAPLAQSRRKPGRPKKKLVIVA